MNWLCLRLFLWIAGFLALGELGLEIRANQRGWESILFGLPSSIQSNQQGQRSEEDYFGPTQSFPFRSRVIPTVKPPGNRRYWVASSSHAEDTYLPASKTFPDILGRLLIESGVNAAVLNASRAGNDIPGNINDLQRWGSEWKPDCVILYQMSLTINSIAKRIFSGSEQKVPLHEGGKDEQPFSWANRLIERTAVYAHLKGQMTARIGMARVLANDLGSRGDQEFSAMIYQFIGASKSIGSIPVLTTFATSHVRKDLPHFPEEIALFLFKYSSVLSVEGWITSVERFNAIVRRIAVEERVGLIDLDRIISGNREYFRDFVHFTPAGHEAVARVVRGELVRLEKRDPLVLIGQGRKLL